MASVGCRAFSPHNTNPAPRGTGPQVDLYIKGRHVIAQPGLIVCCSVVAVPPHAMLVVRVCQMSKVTSPASHVQSKSTRSRRMHRRVPGTQCGIHSQKPCCDAAGSQCHDWHACKGHASHSKQTRNAASNIPTLDKPGMTTTRCTHCRHAWQQQY